MGGNPRQGLQPEDTQQADQRGGGSDGGKFGAPEAARNPRVGELHQGEGRMVYYDREAKSRDGTGFQPIIFSIWVKHFKFQNVLEKTLWKV
jgi:hypothetical protein